MGTKPELYGTIRKGTKQDHTDIGKIAVWRQPHEKGSRTPPLTGHLQINGQTYYVALWANYEG